jgi:predicted nucleic acid-binding protein
MHPDERFTTRKLLTRFLSYDPDKETADRAGELIYQARTQQIGLSVPDAIIAATAVHNNLTLVTHNKSDFSKIPSLRIHLLD